MKGKVAWQEGRTSIVAENIKGSEAQHGGSCPEQHSVGANRSEPVHDGHPKNVKLNIEEGQQKTTTSSGGMFIEGTN